MVLGIGGFSGGKKGGPVYEIEVNEGSVNMRQLHEGCQRTGGERLSHGPRLQPGPQHHRGLGTRRLVPSFGGTRLSRVRLPWMGEDE